MKISEVVERSGIPRYDLDHLPGSPSDAVEYAVLGTALCEPVLAALRRLAHQDLAAKRLGVESIRQAD